MSANNNTLTRTDSLKKVNDVVTHLEKAVDEIISNLNGNNCSSMPCQNGGTCLTLYNSFICECSNGWTGPACSDNINECAIYEGTTLGCRNNATCIDTVGSYK